MNIREILATKKKPSGFPVYTLIPEWEINYINNWMHIDYQSSKRVVQVLQHNTSTIDVLINDGTMIRITNLLPTSIVDAAELMGTMVEKIIIGPIHNTDDNGMETVAPDTMAVSFNDSVLPLQIDSRGDIEIFYKGIK